MHYAKQEQDHSEEIEIGTVAGEEPTKTTKHARMTVIWLDDPGEENDNEITGAGTLGRQE